MKVTGMGLPGPANKDGAPGTECAPLSSSDGGEERARLHKRWDLGTRRPQRGEEQARGKLRPPWSQPGGDFQVTAQQRYPVDPGKLPG